MWSSENKRRAQQHSGMLTNVNSETIRLNFLTTIFVAIPTGENRKRWHCGGRHDHIDWPRKNHQLEIPRNQPMSAPELPGRLWKPARSYQPLHCDAFGPCHFMFAMLPAHLYIQRWWIQGALPSATSGCRNSIRVQWNQWQSRTANGWGGLTDSAFNFVEETFAFSFLYVGLGSNFEWKSKWPPTRWFDSAFRLWSENTVALSTTYYSLLEKNVLGTVWRAFRCDSTLYRWTCIQCDLLFTMSDSSDCA